MSANVLFGSLFQQNGGAPRDEESLRKFIGVDKKDWAQNYVGTPASQRAMSNYFEAAKRGDGPAAYRFMGQMLSGHSDQVESMLERSPIYKSLPSYQQDIARSAILQSTLGQSIEVGSTNATSGNAPGANVQQRARLEMGRLQRDLNLTPEQAAGAAGVLQGEGLTTGNEAGKPFGEGGYGIGQWTGSRRRMYMAWARGQGLDPSAYETQQAFLNVDLKNNYPGVLKNLQGAKTPEEAAKAFMPYEFGDGFNGSSAGLYAQHGDERVRMARDIYSGYQSNSPVAELNKSADQQTANLKGSEAVVGMSDAVVTSFNGIAHAGEAVIAMFQRLASAGNGVSLPGYGRGSPATQGFMYDVPGNSAVK